VSLFNSLGVQMKCPYCSYTKDKVVDSRSTKGGEAVRRRRECLACDRRFTTYEYVEHVPIMVVKNDGRRQPYEREKVVTGIRIACEKRPISLDTIHQMVDEIETALYDAGEKEVPSKLIGTMVIQRLRNVDEVAYVRFASVYRKFRDVSEFMDELEAVLREHVQREPAGGQDGSERDEVGR